MTKEIFLTEESIHGKIYFIRGEKVMLDSDLADLYQVGTKRINEQVKRNIARFPADFMFQLTMEEWDLLRSQNATSIRGGRRSVPYVFTEHGILMLSSVLNSERAIAVNIHIMRVFTRMRQMFLNNAELSKQLELLKQQVGENTGNIARVFAYLNQLDAAEKDELANNNRRKIGYRTRK